MPCWSLHTLDDFIFVLEDGLDVSVLLLDREFFTHLVPFKLDFRIHRWQLYRLQSVLSVCCFMDVIMRLESKQIRFNDIHRHAKEINNVTNFIQLFLPMLTKTTPTSMHVRYIPTPLAPLSVSVCVIVSDLTLYRITWIKFHHQCVLNHTGAALSIRCYNILFSHFIFL